MKLQQFCGTSAGLIAGTLVLTMVGSAAEPLGPASSRRGAAPALFVAPSAASVAIEGESPALAPIVDGASGTPLLIESRRSSTTNRNSPRSPSIASVSAASGQQVPSEQAVEVQAGAEQATDEQSRGDQAWTGGGSPYDDWPDAGDRPSPDRAARFEELHPTQMGWINAAYGGQSWRWSEHRCAGDPTCIRRHAAPSDTGRYIGYYVGGGAAVGGEGRYVDEGTFGWDYRGFFLPRRLMLNWSHRRVQSGTGAYKTDGPKFLEH